MNQSVSQDTFL